MLKNICDDCFYRSNLLDMYIIIQTIDIKGGGFEE